MCNVFTPQDINTNIQCRVKIIQYLYVKLLVWFELTTAKVRHVVPTTINYRALYVPPIASSPSLCLKFLRQYQVELFVVKGEILLTYSMEQSPSWEANQYTLQLVKKFLAFMEPESPAPYPQVPAICPYPEPTPSSPHNPLQLPENPS